MLDKVKKQLEQRISELYRADEKFCKDRWDQTLHLAHRSIAREESNKVTFARQELQRISKFIAELEKDSGEIKPGTQVMCSNDEDYSSYWLGTYAAKHPSKPMHIILVRERPELRIKAEIDCFKYCKPYSF